MTDIMPQGDDFSYQDVDMDIEMGYMDQDAADSNVYPENVRISDDSGHVREANCDA